MRERRRAALPALLVALTIVLVWWLFRERSEPEKVAETIPTPRSQYYMRDFTLRASNETGRDVYEVSGPSMAYYAKAAEWHIRRPRWTFHNARGDTWNGRSDKGRVWDKGNRAWLEGDVRLDRTEPAEPLHIRTETLSLRPNAGYAETDDPVSIYGSGFRLDGVGARVWINQERMQLISRVEGHYDPAKRTP